MSVSLKLDLGNSDDIVTDIRTAPRTGFVSAFRVRLTVTFAMAAFLIFLGIHYDVTYMTDLFSNTGQLPSRFQTLILAADVGLIGTGLGLMVFAKAVIRHFGSLLLIVGSTAFAIGVLETGVRVYLAASGPEIRAQFLTAQDVGLEPRYIRHHYLGYIPNPQYVGVEGRNQHNSLGFRGEEINTEKPPGEYRIAMIGGSTTYSQLVADHRESWPYQTGENLKQICNKNNIAVINAGVGGYDSYQSVINFLFRVADLDPDLVVVHDGLNDIHSRLVTPTRYRGDNSGRRRPWEPGIEPYFMKLASLRLAMTLISGHSFEPSIGFHYDNRSSTPGIVSSEVDARLGDTPMRVLSTNRPIYFERNLRDMVQLIRGKGAQPILATWPYSTVHDDYMQTEHYRAGAIEHNKIIRMLAKEEDVLLIDLDVDMPREKRYWADNRHVNAEGANIKAQFTSQSLAEVVCPKPGVSE